MTVKIKQLHKDAKKPTYATDGAGCFDLYAVVNDEIHGEAPLVIPPGQNASVRTGLAFEIPPGFVLDIFSRSGHGFKSGIRLVNSVGQIDSDYRGEVLIGLHNDRRAKFSVRNGDRIAQGRIIPVPRVSFEFVDELSPTARGTGGLGSTGK